jgi:hypothetical protein
MQQHAFVEFCQNWGQRDAPVRVGVQRISLSLVQDEYMCCAPLLRNISQHKTHNNKVKQKHIKSIERQALHEESRGETVGTWRRAQVCVRNGLIELVLTNRSFEMSEIRRRLAVGDRRRGWRNAWGCEDRRKMLNEPIGGDGDRLVFGLAKRTDNLPGLGVVFDSRLRFTHRSIR